MLYVFRPGDVVEYRSVYRGRVRWAVPWQVIADGPRQLVLYVAPGVEGVSMGRDADGRYMDRRPSSEVDLVERFDAPL